MDCELDCQTLPFLDRGVGTQREGWNVSNILTETDLAVMVLVDMKDRPVAELTFEICDYTVQRPGDCWISRRKAVDLAVMFAPLYFGSVRIRDRRSLEVKRLSSTCGVYTE